MRCHNCIAVYSVGYEYPEEYCGAYVPDDKVYDFKDGTCGCKFSRRAVEARLKKAEKALQKEYQFVEEWNRECDYRDKGIDVRSEKEPFISEAMHCLGMDYKKPYTRHGKKYYKPYRNYFNTHSRNKTWCVLADIGYAEECPTEMFHLTDAGFNWLSNCLGVTIYNE